MDVMTALLTLRAPARSSGPAPGDEELKYLFKGAATASGEAPYPWRWILDGDGTRSDAPLRAALVLTPARTPHLSGGERIRHAYAALYALELLLHARGYSSSWQSADLAAPTAPWHDSTELDCGEALLGVLTIGHDDMAQARVRRPLADIADVVSRRAPRVPAASAAAG